jgi:cation transport ATPase
MDFLTSNEFGSWFYAMMGITVTSVIIRGYYFNKFSSNLLNTINFALVFFTIFYVGYRFGSGYTPNKITEHASSDQLYMYKAAFHGLISMWAVVQSVYILYRARIEFKQGKNYFTSNPKKSIFVFFLWSILIFSYIVV